MQPDHIPTDEHSSSPQPAQASFTPEPAVPTAVAPVVTLAPDATVQASGILQHGADAAQGEEKPVRWQAYEYIHHEKSPMWFVVFALVVLGLMAVAIFPLQSITFAVLIPVMAATLLVYNYRPPRLLDYTLSRHGLHINDRLYSFNEFKGFRVVHDGEEYSVMLLPVKRFKPGVSVYFPESAGEEIVDVLGARLPMQDFHLDLVDKIIRKLRI